MYIWLLSRKSMTQQSIIHKEKVSIKQWAEADRPREKLLIHGKRTLSDTELIAILIGSGNKEESAVELSKRILQKAGNNLDELGRLTINDLKKFKGIGEAKAISIVAALELGGRRQHILPDEKPIVKTSKDAFQILSPVLSDLPHEEFWIILLNRANKVIKKEKISTGGIVSTVVDIKIIMKLAVENLASSVILCHNHPSGNLIASESDKRLTQKLKEACHTFEVNLLDHLIIAGKNYYSFADNSNI